MEEVLDSLTQMTMVFMPLHLVPLESPVSPPLMDFGDTMNFVEYLYRKRMIGLCIGLVSFTISSTTEAFVYYKIIKYMKKITFDTEPL